MKKIIFSLAIIGAVAAIVVGATTAFFNDRESSTGNTFAAGTIDISVNGENPWTTSWQNYLDKPCQTNYMNFSIKNEGENPARVWKRLTNVENGPGPDIYCGASSEPEYVDGGGVPVDEEGTLICDSSNYVERDNLSAFIIYDMAVCEVPVNEIVEEWCPMVPDESGDHEKPNLRSDNWKILIDEADQVRVDNVVDTWMKLTDELPVGASLVVSQSYHLMTWDDSGQPIITNWAQGDTMTFDIDLEARQLTAPAPGVGQNNTASVQFVHKDANTWDEIGVPQGSLTYKVSGSSFDFDFNVNGLTPGTEYDVIYYADPYPGNHPGALILNFTTDSSGNFTATNQSIDLSLDLPDTADANAGVGAKLWVIPASDYSGTQLTAWHPTQYLFDKGLVNYDDTDIN